jgi:hypothetical protein
MLLAEKGSVPNAVRKLFDPFPISTIGKARLDVGISRKSRKAVYPI